MKEKRIRFCPPPFCFPEREPCFKCKPPCPPELSGIQAQLVGASGTIVASGAAVPFNSLVSDPSPDIELQGSMGSFLITRPGNYFVSWWVNADGAGAEITVSFSIVVACGQMISASSPAPVTTLQLNGTALLEITSVPTSVFLINTSGAAVLLGLSPIQANIVVVETVCEPCKQPFTCQRDPRCVTNPFPIATLDATPATPPG